MDILYLLIPLSALLVLGVLGVFAWALHDGQFDDIEQHGEQLLHIDDPLDPGQTAARPGVEQSAATTTNDPWRDVRWE